MNETKDNQTSPKKIYTSEDIIDLRYILIVWFKWIWIAIPLILIGIYFGYRELKSFAPVYEARLIGPKKKIKILRIDAVRKKVL